MTNKEQIAKVSIFKTQKKVEGKVVGGTIIGNSFCMDILNPSDSLSIPLRQIYFTEKWLDITIKELTLIRDEMKKEGKRNE